MNRLVYLLLVALLWQLPARAQTEAEVNIGVQLYSVRSDLKADFEGTLRAIADMGFTGVEFYGGVYGDYGDRPAELKAFLVSIGLVSAGAHVSPDDLRGERLAQTVAFHQALGSPALIIGMDKRAWDDEGVYEFAGELNAIAEKLAGTGLRVGYHNHAQEMREFKGATYWDVLAQETDEAVILQQDVGWTTAAGRDPVAHVRKYPGRTFSTHYKVHRPWYSFDKRPFVGEGNTDWPNLVKANLEAGGTAWYLVEQEAYPGGMTPLESTEESLRGFRKVLKDLEIKGSPH